MRTAHITQSPSPTPAADILGAAYLAQYEQGYAEGATDAADNLQAAVARAHYALDYLAYAWGHGYWEAVTIAVVDSAADAWTALEQKEHR